MYVHFIWLPTYLCPSSCESVYLLPVEPTGNRTLSKVKWCDLIAAAHVTSLVFIFYFFLPFCLLPLNRRGIPDLDGS
ncbi:GM19457 [Drosophila sechellia]|uniref:GM19457 n=1 Tax=Drosophila sechellia TaxID=7238 RepID=B4IGR1_DROSE|nr:GM19457 [Drosophila sechellia]